MIERNQKKFLQNQTQKKTINELDNLMPQSNSTISIILIKYVTLMNIEREMFSFMKWTIVYLHIILFYEDQILLLTTQFPNISCLWGKIC